MIEELKLAYSMVPKSSKDDYKQRLHIMESPLLSLNRNNEFILDKCYIKESKIHGLGVFAKDDIKIG